MHFPRLAGLGALVALGLVGCAGPRVVTGVTSRGDKIKFIYTQSTFRTLQQGAVACTAGADGSLTACQPLTITFKEE